MLSTGGNIALVEQNLVVALPVAMTSFSHLHCHIDANVAHALFPVAILQAIGEIAVVWIHKEILNEVI